MPGAAATAAAAAVITHMMSTTKMNKVQNVQTFVFEPDGEGDFGKQSVVQVSVTATGSGVCNCM